MYWVVSSCDMLLFSVILNVVLGLVLNVVDWFCFVRLLIVLFWVYGLWFCWDLIGGGLIFLIVLSWLIDWLKDGYWIVLVGVRKFGVWVSIEWLFLMWKIIWLFDCRLSVLCIVFGIVICFFDVMMGLLECLFYCCCMLFVFLYFVELFVVVNFVEDLCLFYLIWLLVGVGLVFVILDVWLCIKVLYCYCFDIVDWFVDFVVVDWVELCSCSCWGVVIDVVVVCVWENWL